MNKNKKRVVIGATVAALALSGTGVAYAYWTTSGTGEGSATAGTTENFTVNNQSTTATLLTPGGPSATASFKVHNPGTGVQAFSQVVVSVANNDGSPWSDGACTANDFILGGETHGLSHTITLASPESIAANGDSTTKSVTVQMWNNTAAAQDDCKGVTVPLYYEVS
jgi:hypothetical protein